VTSRVLVCPACGYGFIRRRSGRCPEPSCRVRLAMPGEYLPDDEPGWFYVFSGYWMEAGKSCIRRTT
jgi:hypothetical protein